MFSLQSLSRLQHVQHLPPSDHSLDASDLEGTCIRHVEGVRGRHRLTQYAVLRLRRSLINVTNPFYRLKARRGALRAALAIAHKILVAAYHMLAKGLGYRELGEAYLDQIDQTRTAANLKRRLERLGYTVSLQSKEAPAVL